MEVNSSTNSKIDKRTLRRGLLLMKDLRGKQVNDWEVLEHDHDGKWFCKCKCGKIVSVTNYSLVRNLAQGCVKCTHAKKMKPLVAGLFPSRMLQNTRQHAIDRGLEFSVTPEYLASLFNGVCSLTGSDIILPKCNRDYNRMSESWTAVLDRVNKSQGYINNNVQWIHKTVKLMKHKLNNSDFINYCSRIDKHINNVTSYESYKPKTINRPTWRGFGEISLCYWDSLTRKGKLRKLTFNVTIEQAYKLYIQQKGRCSLSGLPLCFAITAKERMSGYQTASLDRIDSEQGYELNNIQWVHKDINVMKNNLPLQTFLGFCFKVAKYTHNRAE